MWGSATFLVSVGVSTAFSVQRELSFRMVSHLVWRYQTLPMDREGPVPGRSVAEGPVYGRRQRRLDETGQGRGDSSGEGRSMPPGPLCSAPLSARLCPTACLSWSMAGPEPCEAQTEVNQHIGIGWQYAVCCLTQTAPPDTKRMRRREQDSVSVCSLSKRAVTWDQVQNHVQLSQRKRLFDLF